LSSPINLDIYEHVHAALKPDGARISAPIMVAMGAQKVVYAKPMAEDKWVDLKISLFSIFNKFFRVPKPACAGHYLTGAMTLCKSEAAKKVAQYPVTYYIGTAIRPGKVKSQPESQNVTYSPEKKAKPPTKLQLLEEKHRDLDISWFDKLVSLKEMHELYSRLRSNYPEHVPLYTAYMKALINKVRRRTLFFQSPYPQF
jgi:hypothetical protein